MIKNGESTRNPKETLIELFFGIIAAGLLGQVIVVIFFSNICFFSVGWWTGILVACFMAYHMYRSINQALDLQEGDAIGLIRWNSMLRYMAVVVAMVVLYLSHAGHPVMYVAGVLMLKLSAYMQPFSHKFLVKIGVSADYPESEGIEIEDKSL